MVGRAECSPVGSGLTELLLFGFTGQNEGALYREIPLLPGRIYRGSGGQVDCERAVQNNKRSYLCVGKKGSRYMKSFISGQGGKKGWGPYTL